MIAVNRFNTARTLSFVVTMAAVVFLVVPILVIFPLSLTDQRFLSFPKEAISFQHYAKLVSDPRWLRSISSSLMISTCSAAAATILGAFSAVALWSNTSRWILRLAIVLFLPLFVPAVLHALSLYWLWIQFGLLDTFPALVISHTVLTLPLAIITVSASLSQIDYSLYRSAVSLGASDWRATTRIILPNAKLGIFAGFILCFITSWDEVVATNFIAGRSWRTVPLQLWSGLRERVDPSVAALSVLLILATVLLIFLVRPWRRIS